MVGGVQNIARITELRQRILFTFAMLAVYRLGAFIATPGIDVEVIQNFFQQMAGTIFGLFSLFSGGALEQLSIFSLGIMPYISASIIFQLLTVVIPHLEQLKKEGEAGAQEDQPVHPLRHHRARLFQSSLIAVALEGGQFGEGAVINPGWGFRLLCMITLTSGTAFIMWLGEQITERGIGNGISLIIFASIIVSIPAGIGQLFQLIRTDQFTLLGSLLLVAFAVVMLGFVVLVERGQRRIPIQHARRVVGKKREQGGMSYFPLRVNTAGVIPAIFASSLLMFPLTIGQFTDSPAIQAFIDDYLNPASLLYQIVYIGLIIFFCYFYTAIMIDPNDVAENIKKSGAYIPGIRPGKKHRGAHRPHPDAHHAGGCHLHVDRSACCPRCSPSTSTCPFYFGGTALLIVVGVGLDTIGQIEAHLVSRQYEGFMSGGGTAACAGGSADERAASAAARPARGRQGHPGRSFWWRSSGSPRSRPATCCGRPWRRAARDRPEGEGADGPRRARPGRRGDRRGAGAARAGRRPRGLHPRRLPAHRRPGDGARRDARRARDAARALRGAGCDDEDAGGRLLKRAEIEGRADDNEETIRNRMRVYREQTEPLVSPLPGPRGAAPRSMGMGSWKRSPKRIEEALGGRMNVGERIPIKTRHEIELMRECRSPRGRDPARAAGALVKPGVSTGELDQYAEKAIAERGVVSSFKGYDPNGLPEVPRRALRLGQRRDRPRHPGVSGPRGRGPRGARFRGHLVRVTTATRR